MASFLTRHALTKATRQWFVKKPVHNIQNRLIKPNYTKIFFSTTPITTQQPPKLEPPTKLDVEMAIGVQEAARLYIRHGVTSKNLENIGKHANSTDIPLLERWQKMMETFLGAQVYVLAGLGYSQDEHGVMLYNKQLGELMQDLNPTDEEKIRILSRDLWREVLAKAFNIAMDTIESEEITIADARDIMYKVSQKIVSKEIMNKIGDQTKKLPKVDDKLKDMQQRQVIVQDILVNQVYLKDNFLVDECGFPNGEEGYVLLQCALAEHQRDPLIAQYVGNAMGHALMKAGIDLNSLQAPLNPSSAAAAAPPK